MIHCQAQRCQLPNLVNEGVSADPGRSLKVCNRRTIRTYRNDIYCSDGSGNECSGESSLTSEVSLLKKLCEKRYSDGEDIAQHVFEKEELFKRLAVAGQELDWSLQVVMVLRSLPDSFNTLTTALKTSLDYELTLDLIESKLVD